jgi:hypothetical protein
VEVHFFTGLPARDKGPRVGRFCFHFCTIYPVATSQLLYGVRMSKSIPRASRNENRPSRGGSMRTEVRGTIRSVW